MKTAEFSIQTYLGLHSWAIDNHSFMKLSTQLEMLLPTIRASLTNLTADSSIFGNIEKSSYTQKLSETSARLNITGTIFYPESPLDELMSMFFGFTSTPQLQKDIQALNADEQITDVLVYGNSGGGHVAGNNTTAELLAKLAENKNVVGYADRYACSAMYHLLSQCPTIYTSKESLLGSIGVVSSWVDATEFYEKMGVYYEEITSKNAPLKRLSPKVEGHREAFQEPINQLETVMIDTIAQGRGVTADFVKENFGKGNIMSGENAVKAGMADEIKSLEEVLAGLSATKAVRSASSQKTAKTAETIKGEIEMDENTFVQKLENDSGFIAKVKSALGIGSSSPNVSAENTLQAETEKRIKAEEEADTLKQQLLEKETAEQTAIAEVNQKEALTFANEMVKAGKITPAQSDAFQKSYLGASDKEAFKSLFATVTEGKTAQTLTQAKLEAGDVKLLDLSIASAEAEKLFADKYSAAKSAGVEKEFLAKHNLTIVKGGQN